MKPARICVCVSTVRLARFAQKSYLGGETPLGPRQNNVQELLARGHNGDILPLGLHLCGGVGGCCCLSAKKCERKFWATAIDTCGAAGATRSLGVCLSAAEVDPPSPRPSFRPCSKMLTSRTDLVICCIALLCLPSGLLVKCLPTPRSCCVLTKTPAPHSAAIVLSRPALSCSWRQDLPRLRVELSLIGHLRARILILLVFSI